MENNLSDVLDIVDRLTTAYYSALGICLTIVIAVIAYIMYDKSSLKKEMRENYENILNQKLKELQKQFDENIKKLKSENAIEIKRIEISSYFNYVKTTIRNSSTRSNKSLVWHVTNKLFSFNLDFIKSVNENNDLKEVDKENLIEKSVKELRQVIKISQIPKYFLFKRLKEKQIEQLKQLNTKIVALNKLLKNYEHINIETIDIDKNIIEQEKLEDFQAKVKNLKKLTKK